MCMGILFLKCIYIFHSSIIFRKHVPQCVQCGNTARELRACTPLQRARRDQNPQHTQSQPHAPRVQPKPQSIHTHTEHTAATTNKTTPIPYNVRTLLELSRFATRTAHAHIALELRSINTAAHHIAQTHKAARRRASPKYLNEKDTRISVGCPRLRIDNHSPSPGTRRLVACQGQHRKGKYRDAQFSRAFYIYIVSVCVCAVLLCAESV